jgi:hypothetical protein
MVGISSFHGENAADETLHSCILDIGACIS